METIIITVLITLGSVVLMGGLITLGVVVYKLSKNKLSRDEFAQIESEIWRSFGVSEKELNKRIDSIISSDLSEINKKIDEYSKDAHSGLEENHQELENLREDLTSIINSRCDKLYEKIKESK